MDMKTPVKIFFSLIIAGSLFYLPSCGDDSNNSNNEKDTVAINDVTEINEDNLVTYLIPSPKDMFAFTREGDLKYSDNPLFCIQKE